MSLLSREAILGADDLPHEDVEVPEWGGTVRLCTLTGAQRDAFEAASIQGRGKNRQTNLKNVRARLLALCLVDEAGQRLFGDTDVQRLGAKSSKALDRLFDKASSMNGLSDEDVEELAGNSEAGQSDSST